MPEQHVHFHAAGRLDAAQVDDLLPAEPIAQDADNRGLGFDIVAADKDMCALEQLGRVDHDIRVDGVEGLDHLCLREGSLDLLPEGVLVADGQGPHIRGTVEGVRRVDQDLPVKVLCAGLLEGLHGGRSQGAVEDDLAKGRSIPECAVHGMLTARILGPCDRRRIGLVARPQHHLMTQLHQLGTDCLTCDSRTQNTDLHMNSFSCIDLFLLEGTQRNIAFYCLV